MTPSVSIILPVFNGEKYIGECVHSVLRQSYARWELWIGDDGSKDRTLALAKSYRDPRIHVEGTPSGKGLFGNLNRLLAQTSAPWIRILCQDDVLEQNCLEEEMQFLESHPKVGMLFSKNSVIDERSEIIQKSELGDLPAILPPMLSRQHFFYHGCIPGNLSTVTLRRDVVEKVGGFDERLKISGDYEMWTRACQNHDLGVLHQHTVRIRRHSEQLSSRKDSAATCVFENRQVREKIFPLLPKESRQGAAEFERRRHDVLDLHLAIVCLLKREWKPFWKIASGFGVLRLSQAAIHYVKTRNNRIRPQAPWVLPESESDSLVASKRGSVRR